MKMKMIPDKLLIWENRILPQLQEKYEVIQNDDDSIVIVCGEKKKFIYHYKSGFITRFFAGIPVKRQMRWPELIKRFIHNDV